MTFPLSPSAEFQSWRRECANLCNTFERTSTSRSLNVPPYDPLHFRFNDDSPGYAPSLVRSSIHAAESLLTQYEEVSSQLQLLQSLVQQQAQSIQHWIHNRKSLIAPVRRLSPDLIDLIMQHTARKIVVECHNYDPAVRLSHVCSTWRSQALNYPFLWSRFIIYLFPIPKPEDMHHHRDRIDTFLSRSHPVPLELSIVAPKGLIPATRDIDNIGLDIIVPPILESLLRVSGRLSQLDAPISFLYPHVFPKMNLPILSYLILRGAEQYIDWHRSSALIDNINAMVLAAPSCVALSLQNASSYHWAETKIPWGKVQTLTVSAYCFMRRIPVLSLTNITTLSITGVCPSQIPSAFPTSTPLNLPWLTQLSLSDVSILARVRLETPNLTSFIMFEERSVKDPFSDTIRRFLVSSPCSIRLTHLTLILCPIDFPGVRSLLQIVPGLESLDLIILTKDVAFDCNTEPSSDDVEKMDVDDSKDTPKRAVYPRFIKEYQDELTKIFSDMTCRLDPSDLDSRSSPIILPELKYLTISSPRIFQQEFVTMVQSRCDPPHQLLRLELQLCKGPDALRFKLTPLLHDWDGIRDDLFQLMKDGKMDVRTYNSV